LRPDRAEIRDRHALSAALNGDEFNVTYIITLNELPQARTGFFRYGLGWRIFSIERVLEYARRHKLMCGAFCGGDSEYF
jgi:hypothetical protein